MEKGSGGGGSTADNGNSMSFWKKNSKTVPGRLEVLICFILVEDA